MAHKFHQRFCVNSVTPMHSTLAYYTAKPSCLFCLEKNTAVICWRRVSVSSEDVKLCMDELVGCEHYVNEPELGVEGMDR